jgi:hypothetical protein
VHRELERRSNATQRTLAGARLATISVFSGAVATVASLAAVLYLASVGSSRMSAERDAVRLASHGAGARSARLPQDEDRGVSGVRSVHETQIGGVILVDVGADVPSLDDEIDRERVRAMRAEERLVLWLVVEDCKPCNAVESSLSSPDVQRALGHARLIRLDAAEFLAELSRLGIPMDAFPSFVLLGPDGHATDYVDGSEWDEDLPQNIAPVLKNFVEGTYTRRKSPWHGGLHDDETPI